MVISACGFIKLCKLESDMFVFLLAIAVIVIMTVLVALEGFILKLAVDFIAAIMKLTKY